MRISDRTYQGKSDLAEMLALAHAFPGEQRHVVDLPYRLCSWAMDDPVNIGLWTDEKGLLQAWAVMQLPFWVVDYTVSPKIRPVLLNQILDWADRRAGELLTIHKGHPMWFIELFADQTDQFDVLKSAGYSNQADVEAASWSKVLLKRSEGTPIPEFRVPEGFTVRPLAGKTEIRRYVALHQEVIKSKNMTIRWRRRPLFFWPCLVQLNRLLLMF